MKKIFYLLLLISFTASSQVGNNYLNNVKTMADLATTKGSYPWQVVVVKGFYVPGDGGGGLQVWNDTATRAEIKGWNTKVTGVTTGEWERVYTAGPLNVRWFGAHGDGATDDRVIVQTVINLSPYLPISAIQGRPVPVYLPTGDYWMTCNIGNFTTLDMPPGTEIFGDGDNSIIRRKNTGGDTVGYTIVMQQSFLADSSKNNYSLHDFKIIGATKGRYGFHTFGSTAAGDGGIFITPSISTRRHINRVDLYNLTVRDVSSEAIGAWGYAYANIHNNKVINANFDAYNFVGRTTIFENNFGDSVNVALEYQGCYGSPITHSDSVSYAQISDNEFTNVFEYGFFLEGGNIIKIHGGKLIGAYNDSTSLSSQSIGIYMGVVPVASQVYPGYFGIDLLDIHDIYIGNFVQSGIGTSNPQTTDGVVNRLNIIGSTIAYSGDNAIQLFARDTLHFRVTNISLNTIYGWNRVNHSSSAAFCALYVQNIKNISITNNRIGASDPTSPRFEPLYMQDVDSLIFQDNILFGRVANNVIRTAGTNLNTYICNNIGLDPVTYPSCTVASVTIGQSIASGTLGSILYVDASGNLAQDNGNLLYLPATLQLGIALAGRGFQNTTVALEVHSTGAGTTGVGSINAISLDAATAGLGATLGLGGKYDACAGCYTTFADIVGAKENSSAGDYGGAMRFNTRINGVGALAEAMRITSDQNLLIGTTTNNAAFLQIGANTATNAQIYFAGSTADPTSPTNGMLWFNSTAGTLKFKHGGTVTDLLAGGGGGSLTVGSSSISSGTTTRILYDNSGTLGEYTISGSGTVVAMAASPVFTAPTLGAATATTINKVTITQPATGSTLTIVDGGSLITAGAFALTFTATATSNLTIPAGSNTAYSTLSGSITSAQLATSLTNETGTGLVVLNANPSMSSIILAAGTATAATAPLYFTISGSVVLTSAVAGVMEPDANGILYYTHATSERGVVNVEQFISLTGTYTLTSTTSAQQLFNSTTNGQVTVASSKSYYFECEFDLTSVSSSAGTIAFGLGGTATYTSIKYTTMAVKSSTTSPANATMMTATTNASTAITASNANTAGHAIIRGIIRINAGGTVIPQVALSVAAAAVVGVNSYFRMVPMGTNTVTNVGNWN